MMEAGRKWTPSPWRVEFSEMGGYDCMSDALDVKSGDDMGHVFTKDLGQNPKPERVEQIRADLTLAAAAPDLYEALDTLVQQRYPFRSSGGYNEKTSIEFWESEHQEGNGEAVFWIAAHDALRKARGERP